MSDLYDETDDDVVRTYRRVHANGEQTHVAVLSVSDRDYAAVAYDLNPAAFESVATEAIGYDPTLEGIHERTERWLEAHPKGVLGGNGEDSGGGRGIVAYLKRVAVKLNEYGNEQVTDMQEHGEQ